MEIRIPLICLNTSRLLCTYRKENRVGAGGMGFYVIDVTIGALLHDELLK